ncbi:MAG TPA: TldD/PmbA family protein [Candidatus Aminicenantes bacterium]|nr:TldD/PmbA family protein [Candidatus Aminicenantes bacterium]HRY64384.1 TldD/PmbA family protein [Candidatus Aminicenantes bacterium]HRZ71297.1 TldD/PmbA family protein [Candidatus Aminicenantes bacterium]
MMDIKGTAEQLVKRCLKKGADAAEVYIETGRDLSIDVRKGDIETVREAAAAGAGIRVFVKGRMAFASSNDLGEKALADAAGRAVEFARVTTADPNNVLPDDRGETAVAGLYDPSIARAPMEEKIELAKRLESLATKDPRITKSDGAAYRETEGEIVIANSNGLLKGYKSSGCGCGVSVVAEKGDQRSSGYDSCSRRFYGDLKPAEEIAGKAARRAYEALDPRPVKTQRAAVIFHADVANVLLGGVLGAIDGERVLQGASFLAGKMGQRIAVETITIVDDGTREKGLASAPFDGEGVPTAKRIIVDKGVLAAFLYNTAVAKRAGTRSTGNAARDGFTGLPGIGPHNFTMLAGAAKYEDVVAATRNGLLVKEVTGYGINPVNGNFSGGASGFWIENGRIAFPVRGLTIAGTADEIFNGIDLVADDLDPFDAMAAPTVRIKELQIGGE